MTLLDRYVLRLFLRVLGWSLLAFTSLFVLVDLFDHLDDFLDDHATTLSIAKYYAFQLPWVVDLCLPVGMLLASLFTTGLLSKNREYMASLAAGVSLARLSRWVIVLGVAMTAGTFVFREEIVPEANRLRTEVKQYEIEHKPRGDLKSKSDFALVGEKGRVYVVSRFRPAPPTLDGLSIQTFGDTTMVERIDAARATWTGAHWTLHTGTIRRFGQAGETVERFDSYDLNDAAETPADFSRREVEPEDMDYRELASFAGWVEHTGGDATPYRAALANKLSFPWVNVILVVLGLSLGAERRKTTVWAGFGLTVGLAFAYYLLMDFGLALGKGGALPAWLSAWGGNLVYGAGALLLFHRANR
jgi:lipopolysaccharide export system permease protein